MIVEEPVNKKLKFIYLSKQKRTETKLAFTKFKIRFISTAIFSTKIGVDQYKVE